MSGLPANWRSLALDPPRALGAPLASGHIRVEPEDFQVDEELGFEPAGSGQHVLLKVRKREANTEWVARELARVARCRPGEVGYAGLKDRHAVATQWFTAPRGSRSPEQWLEVRGEGYEVLEAHLHTRKLPRGALAGNRFRIRIRGMKADGAALTERLRIITRRGVPNYFGSQRFGRDGANLERMGEAPRSLRPNERGFVLSAARSLVFNAVLSERVRDGTWERLEAGDVANLDGRGSIFPVESLDEELTARCARLDIHPTGPMWGRGDPPSAGRIKALELDVASRFPEACAIVEAAGMDQERRSLRLAVGDLQGECVGDDVVVGFRLMRGSFATVVLREIADTDGEG